MQNIDTSKYNNLESFISVGKYNSFNIENTSLYYEVDNLQIPTSNIFYEKYRGLILNNCIKVKVPNKSMAKYKYRPKSLSYDLYGTTDLWYLLLWINNMYSTTQFNQQIIYIFNPEKMSILSRIINEEKELLLENINRVPVIDIEKEKTIKR